MLEKIILYKKEEVRARKTEISIEELKKLPYFERKTISFKDSIVNGSGIIAEFKRKSPSKGIINDKVDVRNITTGYAKAGVSALSVLTDTHFFGGSLDDLLEARAHNQIPILRKDFVVDEFQLYEAKAYGADVILLIAAALSKEVCLSLAKKAKELGLEVLLEVHTEEEIAHHNEFVDVLGVNNRNLKTFEVSIEESIKLTDKIPSEVVKISESGLSDIENILKLKAVGYRGFLMGEYFMKHQNPDKACEELIKKMSLKKNEITTLNI